MAASETEINGFVKFFRVCTGDWVASSYADGRIGLVDVSTGSVVLHGRLPGDCKCIFDVSPDGRALATGYVIGPTYAIEVWDISTGGRMAKSRKTPIDIMFGPTGKDLIVRPLNGSAYIWNYAEDTTIPLRYAENPMLGFRDNTGRVIMIPTSRSRCALHVQWSPIRLTNVQLPVTGVIWQIRQSPQRNAIAFSDSQGWICALSYPERELMWRRRWTFDGGCDRICYSGDGRYIAASILQDDSTFKAELLDASTGHLLRILTLPSECTYPLEGSSAVSHRGEIIDLETGRVSQAFSNPKWWSRILRGKPKVLPA